MRDAKAMGYASSPSLFKCVLADERTTSLDAFALNLGDPTANFVPGALFILFDAAVKEGFKLFLSMDLYASGDVCSSHGDACNGVRILESTSALPYLMPGV